MSKVQPQAPQAESAAAGAVTLDQATIRFGEVTAFQDVSLDIRPGEFVSVVGPSGCGKTTILNYIAGLLPREVLSEGSIDVLGEAPTTGNPHLGYMLARDSLLPWRTALGNAEFGMEARGVAKAERRARAHELLARVGLKDFEKSYPKMLSHGMRQRVALARTFCLDAELLLMDEPYGALDAQTKFQLEELLMDLWQGSGRTVLFITHDLAEAIALGDRVVVMAPRPGRIISDIEIDLPRPRNLRALQRDTRYHELYRHVWSTLEEGFENTGEQQ
ncbi:ABC transporter ATP-binding protein [Halomonas ramblicola]|uniref:ABC transporter ATP-binding protein n=1 Tax=Halomonas ramblicola TaxID=747349 RepID=UPI0025B4F815|nr:ABC transporter ATP-binding protein [Halomonas ramblicola]MDN3521998.1 ABC transporter ATP-binding protein [Halomonas ramblicola]